MGVKGHDVIYFHFRCLETEEKVNLLKNLPRSWRNMLSRFTGSKGFLVGTQPTVAELGFSYLLVRASPA